MRWLTPICVVLVVGQFYSTCEATGRFYGTLNATYQHTTRENTSRVVTDTTGDSLRTTETTSKYGQSELLINYEDVLFSKNYLRLASSIYGRQVNDAGRWEVRSIYYLDLKSTGYAYSSSYSPYSQTFQLRLPDGTLATSKLFYRDWRNTINLNYSRWPTLNITYNFGKSFDKLDVRRLDTRNRNVILESNYALGPVAVRGNYTQSRSENRLVSPRNITSFRTMNGTTSFAQDFPRLGYLSATYSLLDSRMQTQSIETVVPLQSKVHSVTGFYNTRSYHGVSGSAGYSGRFTRSRTPQDKFTNRDESFSGQIGYAPFSFLSFDVTKIYQIASRVGGHRISEYLTVSSTVNRYLRRGVDTRFSWARTFYQQVEGSEDSTTTRGGGYSTDSYYASLAAVPYPHTRLLCDLSIARSNAPETTARRYLITRSLNLLLNASRKLEGRLGASFSYQGPEFTLNRSYSRNVNAGASYFPGGNINMNLTYVRSVLNSTPRLANSSLNTYIGYTFRQVLTLYLSLNRQLQEIPEQTEGGIERATVKPYTVNAQAQLRLTARSTFTLGYIHTDGSSTAGPSNKSGILQAVYNGQF